MTTPNLFGYMLTPSKVGVVQIWKVLESFEFLDSLQSSKTFNFPAIDFDKDSMLALEIDMSAIGNVNVDIIINGITSGVYFQDGSVITTFPTAETIIDVNSANNFRVSSIQEGGRATSHIFYFQLNKAGTSQFVSVQINSNRMSALSGGRSYKTTGKINQNISSISSLKVDLGGGLFTVGSRISLNKVSR